MTGQSNGAGPARRRTRTRTGCLNCRRKKRKCDEARPACRSCCRRSERCEWGLKVKFREENAQSIDETHPSMRCGVARSRVPGAFEILDVTSEVIRDYNSQPSLEDEVEMPPSEPRALARPDDTAPPSSAQQQTESAVANLIYLSQSGQSPSLSVDPSIHLSVDTISGDMFGDHSYMDRIEVTTTTESPEDGGPETGSAYRELHSTLRSHLIQEVSSDCFSGTADGPLQALGASHTNLGPASLLSAQEECTLWKNWTDEITPWLDKFDRDRHFQLTIPTMAQDHDYLRCSILALSARQIELKGATPPMNRSLALYQDAIRLLLPHLPTRSIAVIATCVILCVLEMLSCSPKAWRGHLDGCAGLMDAVGINGFVGGVEQALFWCFARMDVCCGLISSAKTLIPVTQWASKAGIDADMELFWVATGFEHWANCSVYLIASVLDLLAPLPTETLRATTRDEARFRERWLDLWGYITDWYRRRPTALLPIMTIPSSEESPFPTILYSNPAAISGNQLHHTASILMLQNQPSTVRLTSKPRSILWHARQICGIGISNDHHGAWTNGIQPLWVAGRCMSHASEHRAILDLLEKIERGSGWGTRWRAEDLKEYWGDLGD